MSRLWTETENASEFLLQAGKAHNLRLAIRRLDGVEVPAGAVFSFWAQLGRATRRRGYVRGRELREGCLIPSVGGGLCQLSNALYDAALKAGFEIVERHAHSRAVPGSAAAAGRDATVFWNYVDLRWRAGQAFRIEARMTEDLLTVRLRSHRRPGGSVAPARVVSARRLPVATNGRAPESCASCGVSDCFRHSAAQAGAGGGRSAFLVDDYWPEFDEYIRDRRGPHDLLCLPLDGRRFGKSNYAWDTEGFGEVRESRRLTALRALESRRLSQQGAARQKALLNFYEKLTARYASQLTYDVTHLCVMQPLLPFLWRDGHLGGRVYDVLMTATPLMKLHESLNGAYALHPESRTLADFRADEWLVRAESEALRGARKIITPHTEIAALYEEKAVLLDWRLPCGEAKTRAGTKVVFAGPTVGRKGAYEMREAARRLRLSLVVAGAQLEGDSFWSGLQVAHARGGGDWLEGACAVVLPAFVEHRPRRLLEAVARGVPVIASTACGLRGIEGVSVVPVGDAEAVRLAIEKLLADADRER